MARRRSHGTGSVVKDKASGVYQFFWTDADGRRHKKSLRTKSRKEAEAKAAEFEQAIAAKDKEQILLQQAQARRIIHSQRLPLTEVWSAFLSTNPTAGPGTLGLYERSLNEFIDWLATERPSITSLPEVDLQTAIAYMERVWERGVSASTYNDKRNALGHITKRLANKFGIDINPWPRTERMKGTVQQKRLPLTRKQASDLLERFEDPNVSVPYRMELRCLTGLCLYAGMRLTDALSLRWADIDENAGCIRYTPAKTARTSSVEAVVPVLPPLRRYLDALPPEDERVLPQAAAHYERSPDYIKEHMLALIHGVTGEGKQEARAQRLRARSQYGIHSLRHTFATEAARAGAPVAYLSLMTGDTLQTLQRFYIQVGYGQEPVQGFGALIGMIDTRQSSHPDRQRLAQLAEELPLATVQEILAQLRSGQSPPLPRWHHGPDVRD